MKKTFLAIILLSVVMTIFPVTTPLSVAFSNSTLQRASGIEASYNNPANIDDKIFGAEYMFLALSAGFNNNFLSLSPFLKGEGSMLYDDDKKAIIGKLYKSGTINGHLQLIIAGLSLDKWSFSTSVNAYGYGRLDKNYLKIAFEGNDYGAHYDFSKNTGMAALLYQDLTVGYGGVNINDYFPDQMENFPDVLVGVSASYLFGGMMYEVDKYLSNLSIAYPDNELDQYTVLRESIVGSGFKMNIGLSSKIVEYEDQHFISAGISFDNLLGFIHWKDNKFRSFFYNGNFDDDKFDWIETNENFEYERTGYYTSRFPIIFRFGSKYAYKDFSFSADFEQSLWKHPAFGYDPEVSFGVEQVFFGRWPIQLGYRLPINDVVAAYSAGTGYRFDVLEFGVSMQVDNSEHYRHMKGLSLGMFTKIRYDW